MIFKCAICKKYGRDKKAFDVIAVNKIGEEVTKLKVCEACATTLNEMCDEKERIFKDE